MAEVTESVSGLEWPTTHTVISHPPIIFYLVEGFKTR
jgi:hypothetical protein